MRGARYVCLFVLLSWSLAAAEAPRRYISHTARVSNEYIVVLDDSVPANAARAKRARETAASPDSLAPSLPPPDASEPDPSERNTAFLAAKSRSGK